MTINFSSPYEAHSLNASKGWAIPTLRGERRWLGLPASTKALSYDSSRIWYLSFRNPKPVPFDDSSGYLIYNIPKTRLRTRRKNISRTLGSKSFGLDLGDVKQSAPSAKARQNLVLESFVKPADAPSDSAPSYNQPPAPTVARQRTRTHIFPVAVLAKAKALLNEHNVQEAVRLLEIGVTQFPDDLRIAKLLQIISPNGKAKRVNMVAKSRQDEMLWIRRHGDKYRGHWIALDGSTLIAFKDTLRLLLQEVNRKSRSEKTPLIQYIGEGQN